MAKNILDVGPLEMEVLGHLSSGAEQSVSDLQNRLKQSGHELAYTTVMTVLVRLHNKGLIQRRKENRYFLYSSNKKKSLSAGKIFERVRKSLFRDEKLRPIMTLLDSEEELSREDLQELKKAVEERLNRT